MLRGMGLWNPTLRLPPRLHSRLRRNRAGFFAKCAKNGPPSVCGGAGLQQVPRLRKVIRFADDLSPLGMTRFWGGVIRFADYLRGIGRRCWLGLSGRGWIAARAR